MSVRATVNERVQWGQESVAGTGVSASLRPLGLDRLTLNPVRPQGRTRSAGREMQTGVAKQKVYSKFEFEGPLCLKTAPYLFSACLESQTSSPFTYQPNPDGIDTIKTLTIEAGSAQRASKAAYCVVAGFRIRFTRTDVAINGEGFGRKRQEGITLTTTPTEIVKAIADPELVSVLLGTSIGGLAEVEFLEAEMNQPPRWAPHITLNVATDSFDDIKKIANDPTLNLVLEAMADAATLFTAAEAKTGYFARVIATDIDGNTLQLTAYGTLETPTEADNDGVMGSTFALHLEPHTDLGGAAYEIVITHV